MKILVFSDVHGNLNSLNALIKTKDWQNADRKIFLGDACVGFSRPNECVALLKSLDCDKIMGNNDFYIGDHVPEVDFVEFSESKAQQMRYMQNLVTAQNKQTLMSWQKDLFLDIFGKKFHFTHYVWENFNGDVNVIDEPKEKDFATRKQMFANDNSAYVFFGHEHHENHFTDGKQHFYCLGAMGLDSPAYYLLVDAEPNKIQVHEKRLSFDIGEEITLMKKAGYPYNKKRYPD